MAKVGFAAEGNADQRSDNYGIRTEIDISFKLDFMLESESRYSQWNRIAVGIKGAGVFLSLIRRVTKSPVTSFQLCANPNPDSGSNPDSRLF